MPEKVAQRLTRILTMIAYVRRRPEGAPLAEVAAYLGCSEGQILKDIDVALLCGAPPYLPSDYVNAGVEGNRVFISFADHLQRPINLTVPETLAVLLALNALPVGIAEYETLATLRQKILKLLPGGGRREMKRLGRRIRLADRRPGHDRNLHLIEEAISRAVEVHMTYYTASRDAMSERDVRPYGLIEHGGHWYMVGWCLLRERELPFRVDRIRRLELTNRAFTPPEDFDIESYGRPEMFFPTSRALEVTIRLGPDRVRWVREERLHGELQPTPDGGALLRLRISRPEWLLGWTLQHGAQAEIVSPESVRRKMLERCNATLALYDEEEPRMNTDGCNGADERG